MWEQYIKTILRAVQEVFRDPRYLILAAMVGLTAFAFSVWFPNLGLMGEIFMNSNTPLSSKIQFAVNLLGGIRTNFSVLSASYTIAIAALFGINITMIVYYLKKKRAVLQRTELATSFGAALAGIFGVGCAACGSFLLSATLSAIGATGALALLPLRGGEFGILSVILLTIAIYLIARKINDPTICKVEPTLQQP